VKVLDLFSGIGGFSLGLERAGMETVAFCEIDPFCRSELARNWPGVPVFENIETISYERLAANRIIPDIVCGGFPCQDISNAGKQAGIMGNKSSLWKEIFRIIREIRPSYAIMENVSALLYRGLDVVLGDLAAVGYNAIWHCIPASSVGAPHQRDRIWIVAYPSGKSKHTDQWALQLSKSLAEDLVTHDNSDGCQKTHKIREWNVVTRGQYWYETDAPVLGMDDGFSDWSHRIKALGNAVVPQIPEIIGRAILNSN